MAWFPDIPPWFGTALAGVVTGGVGYMLKSFVDADRQSRMRRAGIISRLGELKGLLRTSGELQLLQREQVDELMVSLSQNHPQEFKQGSGFEDTFVKCFDVFTDDEKERHGVIRAYTQHSLRPVNRAMSKWLEEDTWFKTAAITCNRSEELVEKLRALEIHLMLWQAKCEYWIPENPKHALVYLADEKKHGLGFPTGIEDVVQAVLVDLRRRWLEKTS